MFDFSGKVVIVTGSSSGIGEDAVISFAKHGAQVVVAGRNADRVAAVAAKCVQASPTNLTPLQSVGDVSNDEDAKWLIEDTISKFGHLDVLVNNAGIFKRALLTDDAVVDKMDEAYRTNVRALVKLTNLAVPHLIASKGNVINVSSVASTRARHFSIPYSVSKAAVDMVTKCCAIELGPKGVRVNSIKDGFEESFQTISRPHRSNSIMFDFSGKVVIVTGSSSGIGENAVISFSHYGAQVVVTGRNAVRVATVAGKCAEVSPTNLTPLQIVGDVSNDIDAKRLIEDTIAKFGHLDILVNNAGIVGRTLVTDDAVVDIMDEVYRTNVRALVKLTNLAAPYLIASKGNVINVSSVGSTQPKFGSIPYSVSKASVDMVTKCCAIELGTKGVRVNRINPGLIETPLIASNGRSAAEREWFKKTWALSYPLRRLGVVEDTTAALLFLASEQASFLTGVHLPVDGGCLTMSPMGFAVVLKEDQAEQQ
ncbi:L-xylulose reductase [Halotydeus destructor]|nr:L-xylulose reductase [Halotydeus destructor]